MNKKGMGASTLAKFILVFLVVFALILLYNRTMKGGTKVLECTANGGECKVDTCDFATQIPMLSDKAAGCKTGEICCVKIDKGKPPADPACEGKILGFECDTKLHLYCDWALQCVPKCEFCAKNFGTDEVQNQIKAKICTKGFDYEGFSCKCTATQCADLKKVNSTFCILEKHCPGQLGTDSNYACCK